MDALKEQLAAVVGLHPLRRRSAAPSRSPDPFPDHSSKECPVGGLPKEGLLALLDDIVGLAKIATASIDDVVGQATKVGAKAAGVVIDDAAVTPRYVVGFAAAHKPSDPFGAAKRSRRL